MQAPASPRPIGVTILAIVAALGGVLYVLAFLGATAAPGATPYSDLALVVWWIHLGLALMSVAFAYGVWQRTRWAWGLGVAALILSLVLSVLRILAGGGTAIILQEIITDVIVVGALYYLDTPNIRRVFGQSEASRLGMVVGRKT